MTIDPLAYWCLRGFFAGLFLLAAIHKINDLQKTATNITAYTGLTFSPFLGRVIATIVASLELTVAVIALSLTSHLWVFLGIGGLILTYTLAMLQLLLAGKAGIDCGCSFGGTGEGTKVDWKLISRNSLLLALSSLVLFEPSTRTLVWLDAFTGLFFIGCSLLAYYFYDQLLSNLQRQKGLTS